jgi:hypothetical protein
MVEFINEPLEADSRQASYDTNRIARVYGIADQIESPQIQK